MRPLDELVSVEDSAWPDLQRWIGQSPRTVQVLPSTQEQRGRCLLRLQVTTRSLLGALAWHTGGLLLDHGWLRVLGGGGAGLDDIVTASGWSGSEVDGAPPFLVAGYDVLGGRFAVNGGGLPGEPGEVVYFAPDRSAWEPLGVPHSAFVEWCLIGDTGAFYDALRWPGWEAEVDTVGPARGLLVYPPLWTVEGAGDLSSTSRRPLPFREVLGVQDDLAAQVGFHG